MASTEFLLSNMRSSNETIAKSFDFKGVLPISGLSMQQNYLHADFSPISVTPGDQATVDVKFDSKYIELDKEWYVYFTMATSDATNHLTLFNDCYTLIDDVELTINGSTEKWRYKENWMIEMQRANDLKENIKDRSLDEHRSKSDIDYAAYTGIEVTNAAVQPFYFSLFAMFPRLRNQVMRGIINDVKLRVRFAPGATSAANACRIGQSNTTSNAYAKSSVTFSSLKFLRIYDIIQDNRTFMRPMLKDVILPMPRYERYLIENQSWNSAGSDYVQFNIQDQFKNPMLQRIHVFVRDIGVAYNDANAQKKFSGWDYIAWKLAEQNGDRNEIDFTSSNTDFLNITERKRALRNYEIEYQLNSFGEHLPSYSGTHGANNYLLCNTVIPMNSIKIHEQVYDVVSNINPNTKNMTLRLECNTAVSAACDIEIIAEYYDMYRINEQGRLILEGV